MQVKQLLQLANIVKYHTAFYATTPKLKGCQNNVSVMIIGPRNFVMVK